MRCEEHKIANSVAADTHAFQVSSHTAYITVKSYTPNIVSVNIVSDNILVVKCGDEVIHEYKFACDISIFHYRVIDNSTILIELHTK